MDVAAKEVRYHLARFDEMFIEKGILEIRTAVDDGQITEFRTVVPRASRQYIFKQADVYSLRAVRSTSTI